MQMSNVDTARSPWRVESPYVRSLLAGGLAGTTVDLSLFPLDTLKTRLQSSSGFVAAGGFSNIFRGVGSAFVGSAPGAALFFVTYDGIKRAILDKDILGVQNAGVTTGVKRAADGTPILSPTRPAWLEPTAHIAAASMGEIAACAVRVPTEVIKQRAQAKQHPSSLSALTAILQQYKTRGAGHVWKELYRGWSITIFREVPFTVIQFPLWEALKQWWAHRGRSSAGLSNGKSTQISGVEAGVLGSIAGAVAAATTTPLDVLKTRMMLATERIPMTVLVRQILEESGPRAFFSGIGPRVGWISVGGAIFLGTYQWAINMLGGDEDA